MGNESALIIPVPEVEPLVGPLRLRYDHAARLGVPAHITLLYPFHLPQVIDREIKILEELCASIKLIPFSFTEVRYFPATAYLHPDRPEPFAQIIRTLMKMWPDCQPYGGAFRDIVPHLTVADQVDAETLRAAGDSICPRLPIECVAREICLLTSDPAGVWSKKASFPLAD
jgi:2'-5' RNA ligase